MQVFHEKIFFVFWGMLIGADRLWFELQGTICQHRSFYCGHNKCVTEKRFE